MIEISGKAVLLVERFDREAGSRLGYVSAMTMLEARDGSPGSYLEIAEVIENQSPAASDDLAELWRRIAFSILISNTDDHLRNHGFLRRLTAGWSLAPAFDLNPNPDPGPKLLNTAIDYDRTLASTETLMEVAPEFRLSPEQAGSVLGEVSAATRSWREAAAANGLNGSAQENMAPAFENEQARLASELGSSS